MRTDMATTIDQMPEAYRKRMMQTAHTFKVGDHTYKCHALMPLEQVHMARRLAPIMLAALKPEDGRKAILARLMKFSSIAAAGGGEGSATPANPEAVIDDVMDLAISLFEAAAATNEAMVDDIIRKVMKKTFRELDSGGAMTCWETKFDVPTYPDIDGFTLIAIVVRYLVSEFQGRIGEYILSLGLKPGPALTGAAGIGPRPPGAPGAI